MPVQIGVKAQPFSNPMGLLSDCHRRIEMFLGMILRAAEAIDRPLPDDARIALENALRYFREAAPKHTADEEESLFPRLRRSHLPEAESALTALDALEDQHKRSNHLHGEVHTLGMRCLERGKLSIEEARRFREAAAELALIYKEHIHIEDNIVFPAAVESLSGIEKAAIGREMSARRGLSG